MSPMKLEDKVFTAEEIIEFENGIERAIIMMHEEPEDFKKLDEMLLNSPYDEFLESWK